MYIDYLICYGRGIASIAKQLGTTEQEAQNIYDSVLEIFSGLKKFDEDSKRMAMEKGYVTTIWGRRRRLPDIRLPDYSISYTQEHMKKAERHPELPTELTQEIVNYWTRQLEGIKYRSDYQRIKEAAALQGINIVSNQAFKARAARQTVNARVQGSAASMSKIAMVKVAQDKRLNELGFRVLIQVHDELIGECPYENRKEAAERFAEVMSTCVIDKIDLPFSCDCDISEHWLGTSISADDVNDDIIDELDEDED
jgi:DNA polymerase I-like protein with 3'-5' exonuclease and polymerase domains